MRVGDRRWKDLVPKLLDLVATGADGEKEQLRAVTGILSAMASEEIPDEIVVMQRLAPLCYTFATRSALAESRKGVAQRAGVPLGGHLSVVNEEAAGAFSPAAEREGDLSRPEQPPGT